MKKNIHGLSDEENEMREFIKFKLSMTDEEFDNTPAKDIKRMLEEASLKERSN